MAQKYTTGPLPTKHHAGHYILSAISVLFIIVVILVAWQLSQKQTPQPRKQPPTVSSASPLDQKLATMSLRDKIASLLIIHDPGTDIGQLAQFVQTYHPGGFILMGDNIPMSDTALQAITKTLRGSDAHFPRLVATDEEGGTVKRLPGDTYDSALTLKNQPLRFTTDAFASRSAELQQLGITLNFGIIADTTDNPDSFIYPRVLGTTPATASARVAAAVAASTHKTLSTLKHFPGHGETAADSHVTIPASTISYQDWQRRDEPAFRAGINAGANVVMMGHLRYTAVDDAPASLSTKWHAILRHELGFRGIIVTDDMIMLQDSGNPAYADPAQNAVSALQAGNTMLLYVTNHGAVDTNVDPATLIDAIATAATNGQLAQSVITADAKQVLSAEEQTASF